MEPIDVNQPRSQRQPAYMPNLAWGFRLKEVLGLVTLLCGLLAIIGYWNRPAPARTMIERKETAKKVEYWLMNGIFQERYIDLVSTPGLDAVVVHVHGRRYETFYFGDPAAHDLVRPGRVKGSTKIPKPVPPPCQPLTPRMQECFAKLNLLFAPETFENTPLVKQDYWQGDTAHQPKEVISQLRLYFESNQQLDLFDMCRAMEQEFYGEHREKRR